MTRSLSTQLLVILIAFLLVGGLYAINTPPWQAPDEPAHYNYIAQISGDGCCPSMETGDWDSETLEELKAEQFPDEADLSQIEYEDHQPPLYYLLGSIIYSLTDGSLFFLRFYSLLLNAGVVAFAFLITRHLLPKYPLAPATASIFMGFIPQNLAISSSVNNDSMANLLVAILLWVILRFLKDGPDETATQQSSLHRVKLPLFMGTLLGIGLISKLSTYSLLAVVFLALLLFARKHRYGIWWVVKGTLFIGIIALVIGGWWWFRNISVYGWPDFLAQQVHGRVVIGQLRTAQLIGEVGSWDYLASFIVTTFKSFWGQFGWMAVPMPSQVYAMYGVFSILAAFGCILPFFSRHDREAITPIIRSFILVLLLTLILVVLQYFVYNITFVQFQGRYLFTALVPIAVFTAMGYFNISVAASRVLGSRFQRWAGILPLAMVIWMPPFTVYALFTYLVPNLG